MSVKSVTMGIKTVEQTRGMMYRVDQENVNGREAEVLKIPNQDVPKIQMT